MRPRGWFRRHGDGRRAGKCRECRKPEDVAHAAKRRGAVKGKPYTRWDINAMAAGQGWQCAACGKSIWSGFHVDHRIPLAKGGVDGLENLQLLCERCNLKKGARDG
jgi:5-methylcytosine-specific restriction endonuclease McrA